MPCPSSAAATEGEPGISAPKRGEKGCGNAGSFLQRWRLAKAAATSPFSPFTFTGRRCRQADGGRWPLPNWQPAPQRRMLKAIVRKTSIHGA
ncbi:hypothetical protein FJ957_20855 [Mesorhizobium sp. B2-4-6]|nr:hypothetical protein FJ957_20855 [Mesorhizobium sp. B2-4-6]